MGSVSVFHVFVHLAVFLMLVGFLFFFFFFFSGEFVVVNKHLLHDLTEMGLWSPAIKNRIIHEGGSVQKIPEVPEDLKAIYKYGQSVVFVPLLFIPFLFLY